jgi:hypothetical protein
VIAVSLAADAGREGSGAVYRLAGNELSLSGAWPELAAFRRRNGARVERTAPPAETSFTELRYEGPAAAGSDAPALTCLQGEDGYLLRALPGPALWVASDGSRIVQLDASDGPAPAVSAELLLGPATMLALALRGTFALHASAVRWGERAVAFVGPSGAGKSTLAALLAAGDLGCERLADDILPFSVSGTAASARPAFPQLKLPAEDQWDPTRPESLPLAAVYRLAPPPADEAPRIEPLSGAEALAVLAKHSVASALFGRELLRRHLVALAAAGRGLRIGELHYPRRADVAPSVRALLQEELDG